MKKKILIIGASSGIGKELRILLNEKFNVTYTSLKKKKNLINFDLNKKYKEYQLKKKFNQSFDLIILNSFTKVRRIEYMKFNVNKFIDFFKKNYFSYINLVIFLLKNRLIKNVLLINSKSLIAGGFNIYHYTSLKAALEFFFRHLIKDIKSVKFYDIKLGPVLTEGLLKTGINNKSKATCPLNAAKKIVRLISKKILIS